MSITRAEAWYCFLPEFDDIHILSVKYGSQKHPAFEPERNVLLPETHMRSFIDHHLMNLLQVSNALLSFKIQYGQIPPRANNAIKSANIRRL